jgi:endogenous inhibitor of DNA gyrase (YacG/DUF329 family)
MVIDGHCKQCNKDFNAHWTKYPTWKEGILNPYCPYCKSLDVNTWTDESNDPQENVETEGDCDE